MKDIDVVTQYKMRLLADKAFELWFELPDECRNSESERLAWDLYIELTIAARPG